MLEKRRKIIFCGLLITFFLPLIFFYFSSLFKSEPSLFIEKSDVGFSQDGKSRKKVKLEISYNDGRSYQFFSRNKGEGPELMEGEYYIISDNVKKSKLSEFGNWSCEIANISHQKYIVVMDIPFSEMKRRLKGDLMMNGIFSTKDGAKLPFLIPLG